MTSTCCATPLFYLFKHYITDSKYYFVNYLLAYQFKSITSSFCIKPCTLEYCVHVFHDWEKNKIKTMNFRYGGDVTWLPVNCECMYVQSRTKMHTTTCQTTCVEQSDFFFPLKIFIELSKHRKTNVTTKKSLIQTNNTEAGGVNEQNMLNKEHILTVLAAKYCWALFKKKYYKKVLID